MTTTSSASRAPRTHADAATRATHAAPTTAPGPAPHASQPAHEHRWRTESSHATSAGTVSYRRCSRCGARAVELRGEPVRLSR